MKSSTIETAKSGTPCMNYEVRTYEIISKVAYLIGAPVKAFEREQEPPKEEVFRQLEKNKNSRIIRHLCIIRTAIEKNYQKINGKMKAEYISPTSMPEFIPEESIKQLMNDNVSLSRKTGTPLIQYIFEINRLIIDRINNCKSLFPAWIKWQYIRELFIMPDGESSSGAFKAARTYYSCMRFYPYGAYINWDPSNEGNILASDQRFLGLLYSWHKEEFADYSRLSSKSIKESGNLSASYCV